MTPTVHDDPLLRDVPVVEGWKVLAPAVIYAKVGQGGMGAVYRGHHLEFDIDVAVKCLKPSLAAEDEQFVARFKREARLAAELTHENLVRVYDSRRGHGLHYLVMEFVEGETARERVQRKKQLSESEAATIVLGAARGLSKAHRHDEVVVHRDIKPDNILVSRRGEVKLADLGIAKALEREDGATFSTQGAIGTPQYMAPEQWERDEGLGPQADVWSLGATLYFLLAGENAMKAGTEKQLYVDICQKPFPDVRKKRPDVSAEIAAILERCTKRAPSERYADAGELVAALESYLGGTRASLADKDSGSLRSQALVSPPPAPAIKKIRVQIDSLPGANPTPLPTVTRKSPGTEDPAFKKSLWLVGGVGAAVLAVVLGMKFLGSGAARDDGSPKGSSEKPSEAGATKAGGPTVVDPKPSGAQATITLDRPLRQGRLFESKLSLTLAGKVAEAGAGSVRLTRGGRPNDYPLDAEGHFEISLGLKRDATERLELAVGTSAPLAFDVVQDATAPKITIVTPDVNSRRTRAASVDVVVTLDEKNPMRVEVGTASALPLANGSYEATGVELSVEGTNDLLVVAEDLAGNRASLPLAIERDTTPPALGTPTPADGATVEPDGPLVITLTFDEDLGRVRIGGTDAVKVVGVRAEVAVHVPAGVGPWKVEYEAEDRLGNLTRDALTYTRKPRPVPLVARIVLDPPPATAPVVDGVRYVQDTLLALRGRVENASGDEVTLLVDGTPTPYQLGPKGEIEIDALLPRDARAGLELRIGAASERFDVVQDSKDPEITLVAPAEAARLTNQPTIDVVARVVDPNLAKVRLGTRVMTDAGDGTWKAAGVGLAREGENAFEIIATDKSGRSAKLPLSIVRDTTAPTLRSSNPALGAEVEVGPPLSLTLTFDEDVARVTLENKAEARPAGARATIDCVIPVGDGAWKLVGEARDRAGNSRPFELTFQRRSKPVFNLPTGWEALPGTTAGFGGWAKRARDPRTGIDFILVEPGTFKMGSPANEPNRGSDETQHDVRITKPFYLAEKETTVGQWRKFAAAAGYASEAEKGDGGYTLGTDGKWEKVKEATWNNPLPGRSYGWTDQHPVTQVTWNDAQAFCARFGYRLPTEAEFEYSARAGATTAFWWGADEAQGKGKGNFADQRLKAAVPALLYTMFSFDDNFAFTAPVGYFAANAWGFHDLIGNAWEWCQDGYSDTAYVTLPVEDPRFDGQSNTRVLRGGGWFNYFPLYCRSANRDRGGSAYRVGYAGFRVARTLP